MIAPIALPAPIRLYLARFIVRRRRLALLHASGVAFSTFVVWMLAWCGVDRFAHLPGLVRALVLVAGVGTTGWMLIRAAIRWRRRPDWVAVASAAEADDARFDQKLITVTSQVLAAPAHRGSDQIVSRLAGEIDEQLNRSHAPRFTGAGTAVLPWVAGAVLAGLLVVLLRAPGLHFDQLAVRFLQPMADVPPVTTTRLTVSPGDADLVQAQPLTIEARAQQLGDSALTVYLSDNDREWSAATMTPAGGGAYAFSLPSVDRDIRYYVSGGDARSREYSVRVLRRPTVNRFNIRYEYPAYTRLPGANITNDDGRIEAPVGTRVTLAITASESLGDAWLSMEGRRMPTEATSDPAVRQAVLTVTSSTPYSVDLVSTRNVTGTGPGGSAIRALTDLPPQVRLARGGESVSLEPRTRVPVSYEALDDFAIQTLTIRAQQNAGAIVEKAVKLWGDPRRQQDVGIFDLAELPDVHFGDVVTIAVVALDSGGHEAVSPPLRVLVSPKNVDLNTYQRIVELQRGTHLAGVLAVELGDATRALEDSAALPDRRSTASLSLAARADRALSSASQTAAMLRQALLRAVTHSESSELATALGGWVDGAELMSAAAQEAFRQGGAAGGPAPTDYKGLHDATDRGRQVAMAIETVARGEQALALQSDLANLAAAGKRSSGQDAGSMKRIAETLDRMRQDVVVEARQLGLDAAAPDLNARLEEIVAAGKTVLAAARPVDFAAAVARWAEQIQTNPQQRLALDARLSAAAQAEAIRIDADLVRARDLELAARAATTLAAMIRGGQPGGAGMLSSFVEDVRTLTVAPLPAPQLHDSNPHPEKAAQFDKARQHLVRLAGGGEVGGGTTLAANAVAGGDVQREAEDLAMQSNAAAASRQYAQASGFEATLLRRLRSRPRRDRSGNVRTQTATSEPVSGPAADRIERRRLEAERNMAAAQRLDELDQRQRQLAGQLSDGGGGTALAERQRGVADEIAGVQRPAGESGGSSSGFDQPNGRERATAEVLGAIEELAAMPQALAEVQAAASARRESAKRAEAARQAALVAGADQREAAIRAADDAKKPVTEAADRISHAARPLGAETTRSLAARLAVYAPETDTARDAMLAQLVPALAALNDVLPGDDADELDRAASDTREAIRATQRELAAARDMLVKRDPLVAARWFARAAAESLSLSPPDLGAAQRHQTGVFESLSRAWDQSIHRAAVERLAVVPSLSTVLGPPPPGDRGQQGAGQGGRFSNAHEWNRLRDEGPELDPGMRDAEPSGYEQSLKLYFEALGRAGGGK